MDDIVYYLSNRDDDPLIRLCIPEHLRQSIIVEFHDQLGHQGMDNVYDKFSTKILLAKFIQIHSGVCFTVYNLSTTFTTKYQSIRRDTRYPAIPIFSYCHGYQWALSLSRSGNRFIVAFIDLYSGYPEAFAVPDKSAEIVVQLLLDEIYVRYSCP